MIFEINQGDIKEFKPNNKYFLFNLFIVRLKNTFLFSMLDQTY